MSHIGGMDNDCLVSGVEVDSGEDIGLGVSKGTAVEAETGLTAVTHDVIRKTRTSSRATPFFTLIPAEYWLLML